MAIWFLLSYTCPNGCLIIAIWYLFLPYSYCWKKSPFAPIEHLLIFKILKIALPKILLKIGYIFDCLFSKLSHSEAQLFLIKWSNELVCHLLFLHKIFIILGSIILRELTQRDDHYWCTADWKKNLIAYFLPP